MKKAILTVSYGVRDIEEMHRSVLPVEKAIEKAFPDCGHFRAFACTRSIAYFHKAGIPAWHFSERIEYLRAEGYEDISVAALLLTPGVVYDMLSGEVPSRRITTPLLDGPNELRSIGRIYGMIAQQTGREVLLMGHGSTSEGDACYMRLNEMLPEHVHLACRQGNIRPEHAFEQLERSENHRILLMPLMLTAGTHARQEMAGNAPDSWKNVLEARGFDVEVRLQGMGSLSGVQEIYVEKLKRLYDR